MRILYVCADRGVPLFGSKGASVHVRAMANALAGAGHRVSVLAADVGGIFDRTPRFEVLRPLPTAGDTDGLDPAAVEEREALLDREHLRTIRSAGRDLGADLIYERYSLWGRAGVDAARTLGIPHVLEVNAPLALESARYRGLLRVDRAADTARYVFGATSALLAVSTAVAEYARAMEAPTAKVHLFPNAVDAGAFPRPAARPRNGGLRLGFCGGFRPWHGLRDLAQIFVQVADSVRGARLILVGDGPERETVRGALRQAGLLGAVTFAGAVPQAQVPGWLSRMDVAMAPYPPLEPFYFSPLKVLEYMAAGLPVVASRQGDLPWIVRDGETGCLYEPGDTAAAVSRVLALGADPQLRARLGATAREAVLREHTWERRAADLAARAAALVHGAEVPR